MGINFVDGKKIVYLGCNETVIICCNF